MTTPDSTLPIGATTAEPSFRGALASRDFKLLFAGQLGSEVGNGLIQLALPWLVLKITDSVFQLGFAYFFQFLPMLLFGLVGGVFADRWDRRLTIVIVDAIRTVAFVSVGVIYYAGALTVEHIYAVIFLESSLANFFNPARAALMPNLVSQENLRPANSMMEVARHVGFMVASPVGGILSGLIGPAALFLVDGATFFVSGVTVFMIRWRPGPREQTQTEGIWNSIQLVAYQTAEGLAVIARSRLLQVAVLLGLSLNLVISPIQILLPLFVRNVKNADTGYYALLALGLLIGLLAGSLTQPALSRRFGLGRLTIVAVFLLGGVICFASWPPTLWPPFIAMVFAGGAIGALNVSQTTMLQNSTSDEERGRVSATYYTATLGVRPLGYLAVGALASAIDIRLMFVVLGIMALFVGVLLSRVSEVRETR